jgi:hypothetical protein
VLRADRRHGLVVGLVAVVAAGLLASLSGCSGGGSAPRTLPPLSTTPAAETTSSPPTSKAAELAAVKAVVRRYYALINDLHDRMDPAPLAQLMTASCTCRQQLEAVRSAARKGQHYIDTVRLVSLTAALETRSQADVLVQYRALRGGLVTADGRPVTSTKPRAGIKRFFVLQKIGGTWLIAEIRAA